MKDEEVRERAREAMINHAEEQRRDPSTGPRQIRTGRYRARMSWLESLADSGPLEVAGDPPKIHPKPQRPPEVSGLTEFMIRDAVRILRQKPGTKAVTRLRAAEFLNTTESTLKRAVKKLGMGRWPPAPPGS